MRKILSTFVAMAALAIAAHVNEEKPGGIPDGVLETFTLAQPAVMASVSVHVNGLLNYLSVDYDVGVQFTRTATPTIIVFRPGSIPLAGWEIRVSYDTLPPPVFLTIDAGGPGDQFFSPVSTCAAGGSCGFTDAALGPAPWNTIRYGYGMAPFRYRIPAPNGSCDLALGFAEPNKTAAGQRVFTIVANGQTVADVDVFARAGAAKVQTTIELTVPVTANLLEIVFTPKPGTWNAFVSSIAAVCHPAP